MSGARQRGSGIRDAERLTQRLRAIHEGIRDAIVAECERRAMEDLAAVAGSEGGDTIFAIDRVSEALLVDRFAELAREWPMELVGEGLGESGRRTLPAGATPEITVIVDPIDGTRGLMYQKRPAWVLTGVAPYHDGAASLSDVAIAVQTEIPLVKQHLCDVLWAIGDEVRPGSLCAERLNRLTGARTPFSPRPSRATTIAQGFGGLARFFPGPRGVLAEIDDALVAEVLGPLPPGRALSFEDQYISTGGQIYELVSGHDRWCADLRPLVWSQRRQRGLCCHPYDLATVLIARASGVIVTDARGHALDAPLAVDADVAWIGYANAAIQAEVEPVLQRLLSKRGLLEP
jgi:hypothetical protein